MDKNKIKALRNGNLPKDAWRNTLCNVLEEIVKEIPEDTFTCELSKEPKFWYTSEGLNKHTQAEYLSFAQALEAAAKGRRVTHETWSKRTYITQVGDRFVRASIDSDNIDDRIGITTEMLTGWIVLDR